MKRQTMFLFCVALCAASCMAGSNAAWTWVSGADMVGVYGTKGVAAPSNVPGARSGSVSWTDGSGNLWLFGGYGYAASIFSDRLNDLWKFDGARWTWVSGSNGTDQVGIYGTKGVAAPSNVPGARSGSVSWTDDSGNLWLFGGYGYAASIFSDRLNDLWKFDGARWTWVSGLSSTSQFGVYGTKGMAAPSNVVGARDGSISWVDGSGKLWLFGGMDVAFGYANDLWRFGIPEGTEDFTGDGVINESDLGVWASQWLTNPTAMPSADIAPQPAGDGIVNFLDFAVLAGRWLEAM